MATFQIPIGALTSRINFGARFDSVRQQTVGSRFANLKPMSEFLDIKRLSKPADIAEVQSRVNYNISYFSSNYFVVFLMLSIYSLVQHFFLLCVIVFFVVGWYGIGLLKGGDLQVGARRFSTRELYTGLFVICIPLALLGRTFSMLLWLLGASGFTILGHASFMEKPIENAFSEEAV